jgi:hypothetical protein
LGWRDLVRYLVEACPPLIVNVGIDDAVATGRPVIEGYLMAFAIVYFHEDMAEID